MSKYEVMIGGFLSVSGVGLCHACDKRVVKMSTTPLGAVFTVPVLRLQTGSRLKVTEAMIGMVDVAVSQLCKWKIKPLLFIQTCIN